MLSKHPERCRFPHGHTRRIEVVVSAETLDENDMVLDFKALKLALEDYVGRFDHSMAVNSNDPAREAIEKIHPGSTVVFVDRDPTTEAFAKDIFDYTERVLAQGVTLETPSGGRYQIPPGRATLDRIRVWETSSSWAEYAP